MIRARRVITDVDLLSQPLLERGPRRTRGAPELKRAISPDCARNNLSFPRFRELINHARLITFGSRRVKLVRGKEGRPRKTLVSEEPQKLREKIAAAQVRETKYICTRGMRFHADGFS